MDFFWSNILRILQEKRSESTGMGVGRVCEARGRGDFLGKRGNSRKDIGEGQHHYRPHFLTFKEGGRRGGRRGWRETEWNLGIEGQSSMCCFCMLCRIYGRHNYDII